MEYEIHVKGVLDEQWTEWFDGLELNVRDDETVISGSLRDQSALHGVLDRIRDLGLGLISVRTSDQPNPNEV